MKATPVAAALVAAFSITTTSLAAQDKRNRAERMYRDGAFASALEVVDECLTEHPRDTELLLLRARCNSRLRQHAAAIADLDTLVAIDDESAQAYAERAYNRYLSKQLEAALADYDRAVELDPSKPLTHGERGDLLFELGRAREAIASFDRAIEIAPNWPNPYSQRGRAALLVADFDLAAASFARAFELDPRDLYSLQQLASVLFDRGDDDAALDRFRTLMRSTKHYWAKALHGRIAWQANRHELAADELQRVVARGEPPYAIRARISLGSLHVALGDFEAAHAVLVPTDEERAALPDFPPWLALMRWCADSALGDKAAADRALQEEIAACGELTDEIRGLVERCTRAELEQATGDFPDDPRPACGHLFFGAWRAMLAGDEARADELLLRCVNTGAKDYQQWQAARTLLRRRVGADAFDVVVGAEVDIEEHDGQPRAVVTAVTSEPPGAAFLQGLKVGDVITRISDQPFDAERWRRATTDRRLGYDVHLTIGRDDGPLVLMLRLGWQRRAR